MNTINKLTKAALILSLFTICGCGRTYDFNKDIKYEANWYSDLEYATDAAQRLAALPASGVIYLESKQVASSSSYITPEGQNKTKRKDFGKMLSYYYWKVSFKDENITPLPPSLKRECWLYKVSFTVSDKKKVNDSRTNLANVSLSPDGNNSGTTATRSGATKENSVDSDPSGTWTSGDKNSVYSRLVVSSSGTFSFETVDFTGDVKGGYSGSWEMNGTSIRFKWGSGGADSGSCSGRKTGRNSLVFGSTTFRK